MRKLNNILRFRFDDETVFALNKVKRKSDYVRSAVRKQLQEDKLLIIKTPFVK